MKYLKAEKKGELKIVEGIISEKTEEENKAFQGEMINVCFPKYEYEMNGEKIQGEGRWASGGYTDLVAGDVIFFDWNGDGKAQHTGLVIGTDGEYVYTVEGNSGDTCRTKKYEINSSVIMGYGLMNY